MLNVFITSFKASAAEYNSVAGIVATDSTSLNVRSSPSASAAVLTTLKKGSYVTLISKSGTWWKVEYGKNAYGYCSSSYINTLSSYAADVNITSGVLNVRSGAGTAYSVKTTLSKGTTVVVLSNSGTWSKILYNGTQTGYVSSQYLKKSSSSSQSSSVSLKVPDFKQTDSRWSNIYLGSSGKTIGQIGCTTTCLAMTESFRTGTTIYPGAMSKKLSYSSSGNLYWPSNYYVSTSVSYSAINSVLKQGKPVIVGLRTSSYSTHWVVVTGVSGSTYYVNDPGTSTRKTLSETMSKYPYFYKIAYYK